MKIKAVLMDGDGSTITENNQVPENLKKLIKDNPNIKWIMATGRSLDLLKKTPIIDFLSTDVYHIVDGGSCLMNLDGKCKIRHLITTKDLELLFNKLLPQDINFLYYSPDGINGYAFSNDKNLSKIFRFHDKNVKYTNKIDHFQDWTHKYPPSKILLNSSQDFNFGELYYHQNENNYDITAYGINKGTACIDLLQDLDMQAEEMIFIFNDKNDLPIVEHPSLKNMIKLKVGYHLPMINVDFHAATPDDVASIIKSII